MAWQPRLGAGLPYFSRAFEPYICKDPLFPNGVVPDDGFSSLLPAASSPVFLSPSYLRGSIYLQKLEDAHKARVAAEREGHAGKAQPGAGLVSGANAHPQSSKLPAGSHRGVQYEVVEKTLAVEEDAAVSPLPSRWSKDDKDPNLDVLGDGYEVKHIGRSSNDHEACAIRADHYMPSLCGVYYFEVLIMNRKREE
jgi:Ran-binding protein 9/10